MGAPGKQYILYANLYKPLLSSAAVLTTKSEVFHELFPVYAKILLYDFVQKATVDDFIGMHRYQCGSAVLVS